METPDDALPTDRPPSLLVVLGLLVAAAGVFAYLAAYAIPRAMVQAEVLRPFPAHNDPRPLWLAYWFAALLLAGAAAGVVLRRISFNQLVRIDSEADADAPEPNDLLAQRPPTDPA